MIFREGRKPIGAPGRAAVGALPRVSFPLLAILAVAPFFFSSAQLRGQPPEESFDRVALASMERRISKALGTSSLGRKEGENAPAAAQENSAAAGTQSGEAVPRSGGSRTRWTSRAPDVQVTGLERPYPLYGEAERATRMEGAAEPPDSWPRWRLFEDTAFEGLPAAWTDTSHVPLFYCAPPQKTDFARAVQRVVSRKFHSEVRRRMRRSWQEQFLATPTMRYSTYELGLQRIHLVGKDPREQQFDAYNFHADYYDGLLKQDLFKSVNRGGEADFPILGWGPFVVMDSGSVRLDLGRLTRLETMEPEIALDAENAHKPAIIDSMNYRVTTSVKLGFDPLAASRRSDVTWLVDRYGLSVEIDWLSDVLRREVVTTEIELEAKREGDFAALVNFVFKSRKGP
jgi:hypothetical protein